MNSEVQDSNKKKRAANFSPGEREHLVQLINKYKYVFNGKSDNASRLSKDNVWTRIHAEFNADARGCTRSLESLKLFWKNIKKRTKDVEGQLRRQKYITGGGPPETVSTDRIHESVKEFMGPAAEGMNNPFDTDGRNLPSHSEVPVDVMLEDEGEQYQTTLLNGDWSRGSPALLQTGVCPLLQPVEMLISDSAAASTNSQEATATAADAATTPCTTATHTEAPTATATAPATPSVPWISRRRPRVHQDSLLEARVKALNAIKLFYSEENRRKQEAHTKEQQLQDIRLVNMKNEDRRQEELHSLRMSMLKRKMEDE